MTSATTGGLASTRTRRRSPTASTAATRPGQVLRADPSGRARCTETARGWTTASTGPGSSASATTRVAPPSSTSRPSAAASPANRLVPARAGHPRGPGPGGDLGRRAPLGHAARVEDHHLVGQDGHVDRVVGDQQPHAGERWPGGGAGRGGPRCGWWRRGRPGARRAAGGRGRGPGRGPGPPAGPARRRAAAGRADARSARPTRSSHPSACRRASARPTPRVRSPKATLSRASRWGNRRWSWNTTPDRPPLGRAGRRPSRGRRGRRRRARCGPPVRARRPARARRRVVLPAPLGPTTARVWPGLDGQVHVEGEAVEARPAPRRQVEALIGPVSQRSRRPISTARETPAGPATARWRSRGWSPRA